VKKFLASLAFLTLLNAEQFIVGVENIDYFPQYAIKNGEYVGYARELLDSFAKDAGYTFIYEPLPVKRLFGLFLNEKYDFKYPDNPKWSKEMKDDKRVIYSDAVTEYIHGVMVKAENVGRGIGEIKKLGLVLGFTAYEYLEYVKQGKIELIQNRDFSLLFKQTIIGRVDGFYTNIGVAQYKLSEIVDEKELLVFDPLLPYTKDYYFLSTLRHPKIIEQFNSWMRDNTNTVIMLKSKYKLA